MGLSNIVTHRMHSIPKTLLLLLVWNLLVAYAKSADQDETFSHVDTHLSQQSALWATLTIALSTMSNVPARVWYYPREATFYLKSSPLICLSDVLLTLFLIVRSAVKVRSIAKFKRALYILASRKYDLTTHTDTTNTVRGPIRLILIIFGGLPQAIKLFACKGPGLFLTHFTAACYLASLLTDELLLCIAHLTDQKTIDSVTVDDGRTDLHVPLNNLRGKGVVLVSTIVDLAIRLPHIEDRDSIWNTIYLSFTIAVCCDLSLIIYTASYLTKASKVMQECRTFITVVGITSFLKLRSYRSSAQANAGTVASMHSDYSTLWGTGHVAFCVQLHAQWSGWCLPIFAYLPISTLGIVSYYIVCYDPSETYRPAWAEWLG